jgi:hypothetical protein
LRTLSEEIQPTKIRFLGIWESPNFLLASEEEPPAITILTSGHFLAIK